MRSWLRSLSAPAELLLVTLLCFGVQIAAEVAVIANQGNHPTTEVLLRLDNLLLTVVFEPIALAAAFWIWTIRDRPYRTFGWRISWKETAAGVALLVLILATLVFLGSVLNRFHPEQAVRIVGMTWPFALLLSVINPIFEETIESGYFVNALQHLGMWPSILASALFTSLLHAYEGPNTIASTFVIRAIFGLAYWRWRQLWPLVFANMLFDFLALAPL